MATSTLSGLGRRIGASPGQVAVLVVCLALAAYAGFFLLGDSALLRMLIWFAGAAVVHDLVLFPAYSAVDRGLVAAARGNVPLINHIRVPALGAGLALLMFWPGIVRQGEDTHLAATGLDQSPYLGHWLGLVGVLFGASALVYVGRIATAPLRRRRRDIRATEAEQAEAEAEAEQVSAAKQVSAEQARDRRSAGSSAEVDGPP